MLSLESCRFKAKYQVTTKDLKAGLLTRRQLLASAAAMGVPALVKASTGRQRTPAPANSAPALQPSALAPEDDAFLEELQKANFQFFWEQADPETGLVKDRCSVRSADTRIVASIASTGFGLTAICIGEQRGYITHAEARQRALTTLRFLWHLMPNHRGFFYHFGNIKTGERIWDSEVSSIDTAMLICGVLTCRQHFHNAEITRLSNDIFNRVEWTWLAEDTTLLQHGWAPEAGFLPYRWDYYSELMMMYLLGLGSASHPLPKEAWNAWKRVTFDYEGLRFIGSFAPLFIHQYSHAWFDLRNKHDAHADYFKNSTIATEVHRRFCIELGKRFPDYSDDLWGITASDSEHGYVAWGGPPEMGPIDGTVVPSAAAGSLPFLPAATLRVLKNMKNRYGNQCWSHYGFVNAFNPLKNWYDADVIGIDTGITLTMAENLRSGFVWNTFMKNREAQTGLERAGFKAV